MQIDQISKLNRIDLYEENVVAKIVAAQNARSAQSFPSATFGNPVDKPIYVYAFVTNSKPSLEEIVSLTESEQAYLLGQSEFREGETNPFVRYYPKLSGSIRLSLEKAKS